MGRVRTLSLLLHLSLSSSFSHLLSLSPSLSYLSLSLPLIFLRGKEEELLPLAFLRLDCQLSPDSVENKIPGCPRESCFGERPFNYDLQFGILYATGCFSQQCVYAGCDGRLIWTSMNTLRHTRCGRFKFSLALNTARRATVSLTFFFSISATACR